MLYIKEDFAQASGHGPETPSKHLYYLLTTYQGPVLDDGGNRRLVFIPVLVVETTSICAPSGGARAGGEGEGGDAVPAALCTFVCSRRRMCRRRNGTSSCRLYR